MERKAPAKYVNVTQIDAHLLNRSNSFVYVVTFPFLILLMISVETEKKT